MGFATSGVTTRAEQAEVRSAGLVCGPGGANAQVWQLGSSSFLCGKGPLQRASATNSGGAAGACDGAIELDWLACLAAAPLALGEPFGANTVVNAQCWFCDPSAPATTNLSNALQFTTCPCALLRSARAAAPPRALGVQPRHTEVYAAL